MAISLSLDVKSPNFSPNGCYIDVLVRKVRYIHLEFLTSQALKMSISCFHNFQGHFGLNQKYYCKQEL